MISLIILIFGAIYLAVLVVVTRAAYRWAKNKRLSKAKCRLAAAGGFLVVYLPVFWDHIPTLVAHQYYCATEAGFWIYKTPEQWNAENPEGVKTLSSNKAPARDSLGDNNNYSDSTYLNERFIFIAKHNGPLFLNRWRREQSIVDSKTGIVVARHVDFSTSQIRRQAGWSGWKFWLDSEFWFGSRQCRIHSHLDAGSISAIANQFEGKEK